MSETLQKSPIHVGWTIIPYCADCNQAWEPDAQRRLGQRFLCPSDPQHLASFVKGETGKLWLRIEKRILGYEFFSIGLAPVRCMMVFRTVILALAFVICSYDLFGVGNIFSCLLTLVVLLDVLLTATSVAFISRFPTHPLRSVLFAIASFALVGISFGVFYASIPEGFAHDNSQMTLGSLDATYFSFVTIATLGYGDIHPAVGSVVAKLLVICEILVGLYFLAILLAIYSSWVASPPNIAEPPTYDSLFPERVREQRK